MRPFIFMTVLLAAGVSGYGLWTVVGDSWLLTSVSGAFWGWIGCTIANHLSYPPSFISPEHPSRFDKFPKQGR